MPIIVHGVTKSQTRLSDFTFTFHFHALEKEMATHSNVLAWRIPETKEPGGLPSMGSHRIGHDWSDLAAAAAAAAYLTKTEGNFEPNSTSIAKYLRTTWFVHCFYNSNTSQKTPGSNSQSFCADSYLSIKCSCSEHVAFVISKSWHSYD